MSCFFTWELWLSRGYTEADLRLVTDYIWRRIKAGKRQHEAFRFSNLIGRPDNFEEERSLASSEATIKAKERARGPATVSEKAEAARLGAIVPERTTGKPEPVSAHVAGLLAKWKEQNL
jgi:hypothetical protein